MPKKKSPQDEKTLTIAISSRALFDLEKSHEVFEKKGVEAYAAYQIKHENEPLGKGRAFAMVEKLLALNPPSDSAQARVVEIVLISRNSADTGLRVFNSISYHNLDISRGVFTGGEAADPYIAPSRADLFLSADPDDVRNALCAGIAAATILPGSGKDSNNKQLRIAFDGDAVVFSDESERVFQEQGLEAFQAREKKFAEQPMESGLFKPVLDALYRIQQAYARDDSPIRTALVTARARSASKRVVKTLRSWGIRIDECFFLSGWSKGEFLRAFEADIFFDDQTQHCDSSERAQIPTGHVPSGTMNQQ